MTDRLPIRPGTGNEISQTHPGSPTPEINQVNVSRYVANLEHTLNDSTQWAVFETNGEALWARVRTAVANFLTNEWRSGKLQGATAEQAFYVRCDQTTMTQNDINNGRFNIVIGVAPVKPAEFVIINIGQWTASHKP